MKKKKRDKKKRLWISIKEVFFPHKTCPITPWLIFFFPSAIVCVRDPNVYTSSSLNNTRTCCLAECLFKQIKCNQRLRLWRQCDTAFNSICFHSKNSNENGIPMVFYGVILFLTICFGFYWQFRLMKCFFIEQDVFDILINFSVLVFSYPANFSDFSKVALGEFLTNHKSIWRITKYKCFGIHKFSDFCRCLKIIFIFRQTNSTHYLPRKLWNSCAL